MTPEAVHQVSSEGGSHRSSIEEGDNEHPYSENMQETIVFFLDLFNVGVKTLSDLMEEDEKSWKPGQFE
jgi:hypothetical protein